VRGHEGEAGEEESHRGGRIEGAAQVEFYFPDEVGGIVIVINRQQDVDVENPIMNLAIKAGSVECGARIAYFRIGIADDKVD
jgi:hypothetical protein